MRGARARAGLTIEDVAAQGGISPTTWGKVERGDDGVRRTTYLIVERVLGWQAGSVERVLTGGDPVETADGPMVKPSRGRRTDHITEWETNLIDEIWSMGALPPEKKEELTTRVRAKAAEARVVEDLLRRTA